MHSNKILNPIKHINDAITAKIIITYSGSALLLLLLLMTSSCFGSWTSCCCDGGGGVVGSGVVYVVEAIKFKP